MSDDLRDGAGHLVEVEQLLAVPAEVHDETGRTGAAGRSGGRA